MPPTIHKMKLLPLVGLLLLPLLPFGAEARTPLERKLASAGYELPKLLQYREIKQTAMALQIIGLKEMLVENGVEIHDEHDEAAAYIRTNDLLKLCGKECGLDSEWGGFLRFFAVPKQQR